MPANWIIRGFDVVEREDGRCVVSRDGTVVTEQPSLDAAKEWINDRKQAERRT